jgi:hypothetical protein
MLTACRSQVQELALEPRRVFRALSPPGTQRLELLVAL